MAASNPLSPIFDYDPVVYEPFRLVVNFDGLDLQALLKAMNSSGGGGSSSVVSGATESEVYYAKLDAIVSIADEMLTVNSDYSSRDSYAELSTALSEAKSVLSRKPDNVSEYRNAFNNLKTSMDSIINESTHDYWTDVENTNVGNVGIDGEYPNYNIGADGTVEILPNGRAANGVDLGGSGWSV